MEGDQTISRIQILQKNIKEKDTSKKEASNQKDLKNVLNNKRELPKVRAQSRICKAIWSAQHGILTPS